MSFVESQKMQYLFIFPATGHYVASGGKSLVLLQCSKQQLLFVLTSCHLV